MDNFGITFGIITCPDTSLYLNRLIKSIYDNQIPQFEIIVVGQNSSAFNSSAFDSHPKLLNLTKILKTLDSFEKKNLIIQNAKYDIIVVCHDYLLFDPNWYKGMVKFGNNFQVLINPIVNANGQRFS